MNMEVLRVENLVKSFRISKAQQKKQDLPNDKKVAVNNICFETRSGEIFGILGPNGAGKTTLLRMLGSLMEPTEGKVVLTDLEGREVTDLLPSGKQ